MRGPTVTHEFPRCSLFSYAVGRAYLALVGWEVEGELPRGGKGVLIAAPHTSGWDLPYMIAVAWVFRLDLRWLGKHTLFEGRLGGPFLRWLGGIAVDRRSKHGVVGQVADEIRKSDAMMVAIAPSGTRSAVRRWKSGFYHIAREAQVPVILGFLDFGRKKGGVGPAFVPTGDVKTDMDRMREFYRDIQAYYPDVEVDIRLHDEPADELAGELAGERTHDLAKGKIAATETVTPLAAARHGRSVESVDALSPSAL